MNPRAVGLFVVLELSLIGFAAWLHAATRGRSHTRVVLAEFIAALGVILGIVVVRESQAVRAHERSRIGDDDDPQRAAPPRE